jgi:hypothetical protein
MSFEVDITAACLVRGDRAYFATSLEELGPEAQHTRLYHYDAKTSPPWSYHDAKFRAVAVEKWRPEGDDVWTLCALSERGEVELASRGKATIEAIADAGLARPGAKGYGYLADLRDVGGRLHACGGAGQVYRRAAPGQWDHMDAGLLQPVDVADRLLLQAIDGPAEDDLYTAGSFPGDSGMEGCAFHWDGARWRRLELPISGGINAIHVESDQRVWMAGLKGTLLRGSHKLGFQRILESTSPQLFHDVTVFQGATYLGSNFGLFQWDDARGRAVRVRTGLATELSYVSFVDHRDGVLWAVGPKDVATFDGAAWTRIQLPHNRPV